jgi:hypothetical protein
MITPHKHTADGPPCTMCQVLHLITELTEADKKKVAIFALSQTLNPDAFQNIAQVCHATYPSRADD